MSNNLPAYPHTVRDILYEYREKVHNIDAVIENYKRTVQETNAAFRVMGEVTTRALADDSFISRSQAEHSLLSSTWQAIYKTLNLDSVFSANDKKRFEQLLAKPPELTLENLTEAFGKYWENPRYYILKGLAEVFCSLDPFYRSHSNFGFGVKGLPKRVILRGWGTIHGGARDRLIDMINAMLSVDPSFWQGEGQNEWRQIVWNHGFRGESFELPQMGLEVRAFMNGNCHVHFSERALNLINDGLHEFYGAVMPDASEEKPSKKQESTEVSKDLQFYRTPDDVVSKVLDDAYLPKDGFVLEPSCGDGAFLDELRKRGHQAYGVEVSRARARECLAKGHHVHIGNFLEFHAPNEYAAVVMNPPFYGEHYLKHIAKAIECLEPGGTLVAVLPASAWYKHKKLPGGGTWRDLPMGSFRESGTNVNTGYWIYRKKEK